MKAAPGWNDTIAAIATPPGIGAIGMIRVSGSRSFEVVNSLFPKKDLVAQASHTIHVGFLVFEGRPIDEVVLSLFKGPRSFTGEDVIEIGCHGSPFILQQILEVLVALGARMAKPGEFTQRAYLNGRMDLAQAEAVADLISSNTRASHRTALNTMRGGFSKALKALREELIRFSALIELELDFSQEDVTFADRGQLEKLVSETLQQTRALAESFRLGNVIRNGVSVAIIGKPNAGKSTLLNALLNEERAIVSDIPGTTRDTIEETVNINGVVFRLIDTAGIRAHTTDVIESAGIERSIEKMQGSDLVLYLFDASAVTVADLRAEQEALRDKGINYVLVANKSDLVDDKSSFADFEEIIWLSARSGLNIEALKDAMVKRVIQGDLETEDTIVTNARHYQALQEAAMSLTEVQQGLEQSIPGDLLALDIRRALTYLGEITGEITHEDQLDYIFSKFCIGK